MGLAKKIPFDTKRSQLKNFELGAINSGRGPLETGGGGKPLVIFVNGE